MAIKVQFEIGHTSKLRSKKTLEGFTHDWELYVQGVDQSEISAFVDKVVFNLHDSFPKPKRACKDPPYVIQESGYAGFMLPIDIYFRNRDEPKRVQFTYDLDLQQTGPPHHRFEIRKFIFENPSEEFRQKLLKGGGVPVAGVVSVNIQDAAAVNATNSAVLMGTNTIDVSSGGMENVSGMINKPKMSSGDGKKHRARNDDYKINTFANLFGTPIHKSKNSPDTKSAGSSFKNNVELMSSKSSNSLNGSIGKEKSSYKEKSSTNPSIKNREKVEKKDIQKLSPRKDYHNENKKLTSIESAKNESRNSDKNDQKDKQREKERGRDRKKFETMSENSNNFKRSYSPQTFVERAPSPKHASPQPRPSSASGRIEEQKRNKAGLSNNKTESKSSSIGTINKKTKKYKKDKERDREKRDTSQRKTAEDDVRVKEESSVAETNHNKFSPNGSSREKDKDDKEKHTSSSSTKSKTSSEKLLQKNSVAANATPTSVTSNSSSSDRKKDKKSSHKHKKKAKSKVQEKEQEREKNIDKPKEVKVTSLNKSDESKTTNQINKKLQNKEKINKYKTCSKLEEKSKTKSSKSTQEVSNNLTNTPILSTNTQINNKNNDHNESCDGSQISHNISDAQNVKTVSGTQISEESSNSSFPDIPVKRASKNSKNSPAKRPKLKQSTQNISEVKPVKETEKEDIKRRRPVPNVNVSKVDGVSTDTQHAFVEPPSKILKKEQPSNTLSEPLKSPSTSNTTNLPQTTTPVSNNTTSVNNPAIPSQCGSVQMSAMVMPTEYLNELQELHQKIMTLQDNEELQQIVELIAATGCYEITAKTFDFDLCKLDRNTVQRLQEFLATSVC